MIQQATLPLFPFFAPAQRPDMNPVLERKLRRAALKGEPVAIGSAAVPYVPAELRHGVIRSLLEASLRVEGLEISITTGSPLILRDLGLLVELDKRSSVTVRVAMPAADFELARRIDPRAADPTEQLSAVRELAEERIAVKVLCSPIAPGLNDGDLALRPLLEAAREAGAYDVEAYADPLRNGSRERFLESFLRLRLEHGFPRPEFGRG